MRTPSLPLPSMGMQGRRKHRLKKLTRLAKINAMPARKPTPTLRLRRLAAELRRLRSDAGLTREEVTERTGINEATLYRIEVARARPQTRTLMALLELYGVAE